jgi:hypothetical protein
MPRKLEMTCLQEHEKYHEDPYLGCFANREHIFMPAEYKKLVQVSKSCANQSSEHDNENDGDYESDEDFMIGNMDGGEVEVGSLY